jgi:hypothetical protein
MTKTDMLGIRIAPDKKKVLIQTAHGMGSSLSEVVLHSTYGYFCDVEIAQCKELVAMRDAMEPGEQKDKIQQSIDESLDRTEYFVNELRLIRNTSEVFKQIEGRDAYRDFLAGAVQETVEA